MKSSIFSRTAAFGALGILSLVSFSCNDSGNAGYGTDFNPAASSNGVPVANLNAGTGTALTGLALGQDTLKTATTAIQGGESDAPTPVLNSTQFAATASPAGKSGSGFGGTTTQSGNTSDSSSSGSSTGFGSTTRSSGGGSGSSSSGGSSGGSSGNIASLGDTRTSAIIDPSKGGVNGDGSMSASDALGRSNASDGASVTFSGSGGGGKGSDRGGFSNPFSGLFGGDSAGAGAGLGSGSSSTEFRRDPASLAGQADANRNGLGPMGSQDPANYFNMLKADDNLFKVVERRYVSKSKQWAVSDAQQIRQSIKP